MEQIINTNLVHTIPGFTWTGRISVQDGNVAAEFVQDKDPMHVIWEGIEQ